MSTNLSYLSGALCVAINLAGCAWMGPSEADAKASLRAGMLQVRMGQSVIVELWHLPTFVYVKNGKELADAGWKGAAGGHSFKGRDIYEVWVYETRKTEVVFKDKQVVAWKAFKMAQVPQPN
jgi:hypothetical protein